MWWVCVCARMLGSRAHGEENGEPNKKIDIDNAINYTTTLTWILQSNNILKIEVLAFQ